MTADETERGSDRAADDAGGRENGLSFGNPMIPLMAGMLGCGSWQKGAASGRRHELQNLVLAMISACRSPDEARGLAADMREALASTEKMIDIMVW